MKTKEIYEKHCRNLRLIERAITTIQRTLREYIRRDEEDNIFIYTKILSHLINSWAEIRILKIVYEKRAYSNPEKIRILKAGSAKDKWAFALRIAFSKAYRVPEKNIDKISTPVTPRNRYKMLLDLIETDLLNSTQMRNKIAHGQWYYAFNDELTDCQDDLTARLHQENIVQLQLKFKMFISLSQIIHDLAVSKPTFERDFDRNYRKVEGQRSNFHNRDYGKYKRMMVAKRQRYLQNRSNPS